MSNKVDMYNLIVETAYKMFSKNGFEKTSLSMIAKEVGISKPAIYYYFDSKEKLIDVIFVGICKKIELKFTFTFENIDAKGFKQFMLSIGYQMIEDQENDKYFNKIFNEYILLATRNEKYLNRLYEIQKGFLKSYYDLVNYGVKIGAVEDKNIELKAHMLVMVIDNISNFIMTGFPLDYRGIWKEAINSVIKEEQYDQTLTI
ncbi:TetR/AcrR family transcriptional regulator [Brevibacillus daliensis]|uniref:TetR/AcrR family transcriptional regulator n=1 Tax=Brevibacillus daliensis TaxID=2892995 RepID=UPI001E5B6526|nr:TetR/AcrR family transcriptional regulator [Brevibacillus daliensis]